MLFVREFINISEMIIKTKVECNLVETPSTHLLPILLLSRAAVGEVA